MSTHTVPLIRVDEVKRHPNADRLDLIVIGGWQVAVPKGSHSQGELVLYIEPGMRVPTDLADRWGVREYLGGPDHDRVKAIKLRGEPSFGFTVRLRAIGPECPQTALEGDDLAEILGIVKYVPPINFRQQAKDDRRPEHALFKRYTDIENLRRYPDTFTDSEAVVICTKIHGSNVRSASINGEYMAGSHNVQRRNPKDMVVLDDNDPILTKVWKWFKVAMGWKVPEKVHQKNPGSSVYWHPIDNIPGIKELLYDLGGTHGQVILFGEIYGPKIQPFDYGLISPQVGYAAFDIMLNGKYVDFVDFEAYCTLYKIPMAPCLYRGPYSLDKVKELAEAPETLGGTHVREGVVVRPERERTDPRLGRCIAKYVSSHYLIQQVDDEQEAVEKAEAEAA